MTEKQAKEKMDRIAVGVFMKNVVPEREDDIPNFIKMINEMEVDPPVLLECDAEVVDVKGVAGVNFKEEMRDLMRKTLPKNKSAIPDDKGLIPDDEAEMQAYRIDFERSRWDEEFD